VTDAGEPPAPAFPWLGGLVAGLWAFGLVAAVGLAASVLVWALADPPYDLVVALRIGAMYLGAFHHVPIRIEGELDLGQLADVLPEVDPASTGFSFVEIEVALLSVTALAAWLLFRSGRRLARHADGGALGHALRGATVAPGYAVPCFLVALLVHIDEPFAFGRFIDGNLKVSLSGIEALVFPLAIAAVAGAAGGVWAWVGSRPDDRRARSVGGALAGGWIMLWLGLALSYAGLFLAGVVQPDEPVALLTPSTARYFRAVFERPAAGAAILGHHLASAPNEAAWVLVPAAGGCDVALGGAQDDILCYRRFPTLSPESVEPVLPGMPVPSSGLVFRTAPAGYLLFLLAPAVATVLGGRASARRVGAVGRAGAAAGAAAGVVFALLLEATSVLAGISLAYGAEVGGSGGTGSLWIGPSIPAALLVGLAWGVGGGALGGATAGLRSAGAAGGAVPPAPR
jgi:hypothetical protein